MRDSFFRIDELVKEYLSYQAWIQIKNVTISRSGPGGVLRGGRICAGDGRNKKLLHAERHNLSASPKSVLWVLSYRHKKVPPHAVVQRRLFVPQDRGVVLISPACTPCFFDSCCYFVIFSPHQSASLTVFRLPREKPFGARRSPFPGRRLCLIEKQSKPGKSFTSLLRLRAAGREGCLGEGGFVPGMAETKWI